VILAGQLVTADDVREGWLRLADGRVLEMGEGPPGRTPDLQATWISPGLVDLQVNGAAGVEVTEGPDALRRIDVALLGAGITSYLATIITTQEKIAHRTIEAVAEHRREGHTSVAGVHLEGPFLSPEQPGVHRVDLLRTPVDGVPAHFGHPEVRLVTLAPELPGAVDLIGRLQKRGTLVSLGHSVASAPEAELGVAAGARMVTHLFNAMPTFHHREPGLPGWALSRSKLALGLIADGQHVHPDALRIIARAASERVILVSDASVGALSAPGRYRQAGVTIERHADGRISTLTGGLAGSGISVADAVRFWHEEVGADVPAALRAASWRPAGLLGRSNLLDPGAPADFVLWNEALDVTAVVFRGRVVAG